MKQLRNFFTPVISSILFIMISPLALSGCSAFSPSVPVATAASEIITSEPLSSEAASSQESSSGTSSPEALPSGYASANIPTETIGDLNYTGSLELSYAHEFSVDDYSDDCENHYSLITITGKDRFLVVPEGAPVPDTDLPIIRQPLSDVYLVATSTMCLFDALDGLDAISLSGTKPENWTIENARLAMQAGDILYAGKYSEPDYELILSANCQLSIQSTMIYHTPEVKEKLEELGIPVLVDYSSYESHPLGRTEWIKLYGVLLGKESLAEALFQQQQDKMNRIVSEQPTGKTVAFFYVSSSGGYAVIRKSGDYVAKMIALAGGSYLFEDTGGSDTATATVNMTMEDFYTTAKDADIIIYNSTIDGQLDTLSDFLALNQLFGDFKAVQEHNVWCTGANLYQDMTQLGTVMEEMHQIFTGNAPEQMTFLYRLD
ncbi:MAG: ABC transporter substrate-binding protein [Clostridiales bacterium]|nr:ABC transporter substrate-binding protein [Clostridiales bacterium]